jgi:ubiquinone/menaquinone biosynthesis C-methylase UbiE
MSKKHKEAVRKQFTKTREAFSKYAIRDTPEVLAEKVEFARPQPGEFALDVACGPGTLVLALAPRVRFAFGIDLTSGMIVQAKSFQAERSIANVAFACGDADQIPFSSATFDLVTCQCSIHHMPNPLAPLREMARITKPGGRLMLIDTLGPESDAKHELHNRIETLRDPSHAETLRLTTFLQMFNECALEVTRQALKRRERSFTQWMLRAGLKPTDKRFIEVRKLLEDSIAGDMAGLSPKPQGEDLMITHNEGLFLLAKKPVEPV